MSQTVSPWNLPNAITVARILLVPYFVWLYLNPAPEGLLAPWWAVAVFTVAIATDGLDGAIARRRGLVTNLGKILDPIADKALIGAALVLLSLEGRVSWIATVLILVREIGMTVYRLAIIKHRVIGASGGGKLKTVLQAITVGLFLSPIDVLLPWALYIEQFLLWVVVLITVVTGVQYLIAVRRAR